MTAVPDGMDMIVFAGCIGKNDADVRAAICCGLSWINMTLDKAQNGSNAPLAMDSVSRCKVLVLTFEKDDQIGRRAWTPSPGRRS